MASTPGSDTDCGDRYGDSEIDTTRRDFQYLDMAVTTLGQEAVVTPDSQKGWTRTQMPTGAHLPPPAWTAGMRGQPDFVDSENAGEALPTNGAPEK